MIGPAINTIFTTTANISEIIDDRVYPISDFSEIYPAVFYILEVNPTEVKNGPTGASWNLTLITMCNSYIESWDLTSKIVTALWEQQYQTFSGIKFNGITFNSIADELEFPIQNYGQVIKATINTNNLLI